MREGRKGLGPGRRSRLLEVAKEREEGTRSERPLVSKEVTDADDLRSSPACEREHSFTSLGHIGQGKRGKEGASKQAVSLSGPRLG